MKFLHTASRDTVYRISNYPTWEMLLTRVIARRILSFAPITPLHADFPSPNRANNGEKMCCGGTAPNVCGCSKCILALSTNFHPRNFVPCIGSPEVIGGDRIHPPRLRPRRVYLQDSPYSKDITALLKLLSMAHNKWEQLIKANQKDE